MRFDDRSARSRAEPRPVVLRRVEGLEEVLLCTGAMPGPSSTTATSARARRLATSTTMPVDAGINLGVRGGWRDDLPGPALVADP